MSIKPDEKIMVLKNNVTYDKDVLILNPNTYETMYSGAKFVSRWKEAEHNKEYIQPIVYIVIVSPLNNIYVIRRKNNEKRLNGLLSLGIGGHIDYERDTYNSEWIFNAAKNEILEETGIEDYHDLRYKGLIYSNKTDVDKEHIGCLYVVNTYDESFKCLENKEGRFMSIKEIKLRKNEFETWSQIIIDKLDEVIK